MPHHQHAVPHPPAAAARPSLQPTTLADRCWRARVLAATPPGWAGPR